MGVGFRPRGRTILPVLLSLLAGCSRPSAIRGRVESAQPSAPFQGEETDPRAQNSGSGEVTTSDGDVPFHDGESLPVGTLLTVRLSDAIDSQPSGSNATFIAFVDEPIILDGSTVVPRGASVSGRIESARSSTLKHNRGYVRLTLDLVDIEGRELPIRTASLFARASAVEPSRKSPEAVSLEQGRRLTFRLSEALAIGTPPSNLSR
jgi:hypothetical protein